MIIIMLDDKNLDHTVVLTCKWKRKGKLFGFPYPTQIVSPSCELV